MKKTVRKKKAIQKPKVLTLMDRIPKNEGERLELMIHMTEKRINPEYPDKTMVNQAERLRAKLEEWKKQQSSGNAK